MRGTGGFDGAEEGPPRRAPTAPLLFYSSSGTRREISRIDASRSTAGSRGAWCRSARAGQGESAALVANWGIHSG